MPERFIGAHMPTAGGLDQAVLRAQAIGCTALQIFTNSPQQWRRTAMPEAKRELLRAALAETGLAGKIVSHDSYLINLSSLEPDKRDQSREALRAELVQCAELGIPYVVSHMGAHKGEGVEAGLKIVAEQTARILGDLPEGVTLLMETTAGQGSSLNSTFDELAWLLDALHGHPQLAVCLDTCHVFVAGYDIRTPETYEATWAEFGEKIGFDRLPVVHVNDSKKPFGSRTDRHEHLGLGEIGPWTFWRLMHDERLAHCLFTVETPEAETQHEVNVKRLWDWFHSDEAPAKH
jgi:deoxyribonuclease-4